MKLTFIISLIASAIVVGCGAHTAIEAQATSKQLIFGNGGGFSGGTKSYIIQENGQVFISNLLSGEKKELQSIKKKECNEIFRKASELSLQTKEFNHPGNVYYFIEFSDGSDKNRITWGDSNHKVPGELKEFYQLLTSIIKP